MKKLISFVMAAVLCVGMSTTVMANSVTTEDIESATAIEKVSSNVTDLEVLSIDDVIAIYGDDVYDAAVWEAIDDVVVGSNSAHALAALKEASGSLNAATAKTLAFLDVYSQTTPATITFHMPGVTAGSNVVVLHCTQTGVWENVTTEVGDGYVVATLSAFSPVMIVEYTVSTYTPPLVFPTEPVSPKTADVTMLGLYAAVALAGTVVAGRKAKASK